MQAEEREERDRQIAEARRGGATYRELSATYGVSKERVRQIACDAAIELDDDDREPVPVDRTSTSLGVIAQRVRALAAANRANDQDAVRGELLMLGLEAVRYLREGQASAIARRQRIVTEAAAGDGVLPGRRGRPPAQPVR